MFIISGEIPWRSSGSYGKIADAVSWKPTHFAHFISCEDGGFFIFTNPSCCSLVMKDMRIQFIRCNRLVLEFISWLILFYRVWCWIVTHGSKTQIEAKIKPRGQLWEKNATVWRSWCQKLGPSAPNISSAHRKWFCWCHILHFSTSRHFFMSKIWCPLSWQQWHCYVGCSTAPGIYMG